MCVCVGGIAAFDCVCVWGGGGVKGVCMCVVGGGYLILSAPNNKPVYDSNET